MEDWIIDDFMMLQREAEKAKKEGNENGMQSSEGELGRSG